MDGEEIAVSFTPSPYTLDGRARDLGVGNKADLPYSLGAAMVTQKKEQD